MKLKHLTLVFLILFLSMFGTSMIKRTVVQENKNTKDDVARACREGVAAAAAELPSFLYGEESGNTEELTEAVKEAFYLGSAASLGIENIYGNRERLESLVPLILVCREEDYIIIKRSVTGGQVKLQAAGPYVYGSAGLTITDNNIECIKAIEEALSREIRAISAYMPALEVTVDLPEFAIDKSVLAVSNPAVLAVAFMKDTLKGAYDISLYGAETRPVNYYAGIIRNGRKEVHNETCETLRTLMEAGAERGRRFESYTAAATEGYYPSECCNPLGVYFVDSLHLDHLH